DEFVACATRLQSRPASVRRNNPRSAALATVYVRNDSKLYDWLEEDGLVGRHSWDKPMPNWVFGLSRADAVLFLSRLWATDGWVKSRPGGPDIGYSSTSPDLARGVRALLTKLGLLASIKRRPSHYKKDGVKVTCRDVYVVRVEGLECQRQFLQEVVVPGKPA